MKINTTTLQYWAYFLYCIDFMFLIGVVFSKKPPEAILFENYLMMVFSLPLSCNLRSEQSQLAEYQRLISVCLSLPFLHVSLDSSHYSFPAFAPAFI